MLLSLSSAHRAEDRTARSTYQQSNSPEGAEAVLVPASGQDRTARSEPDHPASWTY